MFLVPQRGADAATSLLTILFSLALASFIGCASAGPARDVRGGAVSGAEFGHPPWEIPQAEWRTQRIVRMRYDGPEGNGTLRLVLRLDTPERFHVSASDRLGRRWWELHVREDGALVLWVRERTFCRYRGDLEIPALSLGPVPAGAVAALLLFRLPAPPRDTSIWDATAAGPTELNFDDGWGRRWTATSDAGGPRRWILWHGQAPRASWRLDAAGMARLFEPAADLELRWRQAKAAGALRGDLPAAEVPSGFRPGACGAEARQMPAGTPAHPVAEADTRRPELATTTATESLGHWVRRRPRRHLRESARGAAEVLGRQGRRAIEEIGCASRRLLGRPAHR